MNFIDDKIDLSDHILRVGTDCSGVESPIVALLLLKVNVIHAWSCDNDAKVKNLILKYYKPDVFYDNIFERNHNLLPDIDLYVCGFCCQSFSVIGKREGFSSPTGLIFFECKKVIQAKKPKYFILENVYGVVSHHKVCYNHMKEELDELTDYNISYNIINTCDYGIPQHRRRLYIVGTRKDMPEFVMREPFLCKDNLRDYLDLNLPSTPQKCLIPRRLSVLNHFKLKPNFDENDDWIISLGASVKYARGMKDMCLAITTSSSMYYFTSQKRFLSLRELCHLQGLPDDYIYDEYNHRMIGNAMSVNVLYYIFVSLFL